MNTLKIFLRSGWVIILFLGIYACNLPVTGIITPRHPASGTQGIQPTAYPTSGSSISLRLIAYYYGQDRSNRITDIPFSKLTDLIYAFIDVSDSGQCASIDPGSDAAAFLALQQIKKQYPDLRILVSVGGAAHSGRFSDAAASDASRRLFARSCVHFMVQNGFDGIDIDWETPVSVGQAGNAHRPEDKQNFTALMAEFRSQLDTQGNKNSKTYLLSAAVPAGPAEIAHFEINRIYPFVDWITVMAYAFYTSSSKITNFNAPLYPTSTDPGDVAKRLPYNGDAAVKTYLAAGVPVEKLSLGVPFYGRAWEGVPANNHGLYQPNSGPFADTSVPQGAWSAEGEITYKALEEYYLGNWPRFWQSEAQEPWLYNQSLQVMVTYEDPLSLSAKADYARSNHLGGISVWQISGDDDQHSLVDSLYAYLRQ